MTARALVALGVAQCVNWGVLYYAFAVLVVPLQRELGVQAWVVTGAFSLALVMSALAAPAVGAWADRDRGPLLMQAGGVGAALLLAMWTVTPTVVSLYIVWSALGLCMAATLYEPAFVIVGRAHHAPIARLRAIAAVTLFGGLASTVFLPLTAFAVAQTGWRNAVLILAALLLLSVVTTRLFVWRHLPTHSVPDVAADAGDGREEGTRESRFLFVAGTFALTSLASAAFTANLIPAMAEHGITPATAAVLGGLLGIMQLPGRLFLMTGARGRSPQHLLLFSLALHTCGLALIGWAGSVSMAAVGISLFALGAGLTTLVRPHLIQTVFSIERGGALNGRVARGQQFARAIGPLLAASLASVVTYTAVFAVLAGTLLLAAVASRQILAESTELVKETL
jgi:MFS family permease